MTASARSVSLRDRLRYFSDNVFSRGATWMIAMLGVATIGLILLTATVATIVGIRPEGEEVGFLEALWLNLLRTLDPGTMGGDEQWAFRLISLISTLGGIFIVSSLIGLLATGINSKLEDLQRGKSLVLESGHTLVLGWSPKIFTILSELIIANANKPRASVVVLADHDKGEMEGQIRTRLVDRGTTRVVVRPGSPFEHLDLAITNAPEARSIIVLNPERPDGDAEVIKTCLALVSGDLAPAGVPVVAEIQEGGNARALRAATKDRILVIQPSDIIARITAQISRQPGLSVVYQELLAFAGDEIYFHHEPRSAGLTFGQALNCFEKAAVMGIRSADGAVHLNPAMDSVLGADDHIVAIAEDDDKIVFSGPRNSTPATTSSVPATRGEAPEMILLIGWNTLGPSIVRELDPYVPPGSKVTLVAERAFVDETVELPENLANLSVEIQELRRDHEGFERVLARRDYQTVIILCYRSGVSEAQADAKALMTLLQVINASESLGRQVNVITELLDVRDVRLAPQATADHFVVSEKLSSLLIVQLSENAELIEAFRDLFDEKGSEMYVKPATAYAPVDKEVTFAEIVESGRSVGETVIGYRRHAMAQDEAAGFGVVINPPKSSAVRFEENDTVIVLAEIG